MNLRSGDHEKHPKQPPPSKTKCSYELSPLLPPPFRKATLKASIAKTDRSVSESAVSAGSPPTLPSTTTPITAAPAETKATSRKKVGGRALPLSQKTASIIASRKLAASYADKTIPEARVKRNQQTEDSSSSSRSHSKKFRLLHNAAENGGGDHYLKQQGFNQDSLAKNLPEGERFKQNSSLDSSLFPFFPVGNTEGILFNQGEEHQTHHYPPPQFGIGEEVELFSNSLQDRKYCSNYFGSGLDSFLGGFHEETPNSLFSLLQEGKNIFFACPPDNLQVKRSPSFGFQPGKFALSGIASSHNYFLSQFPQTASISDHQQLHQQPALPYEAPNRNDYKKPSATKGRKPYQLQRSDKESNKKPKEYPRPPPRSQLHNLVPVRKLLIEPERQELKYLKRSEIGPQSLNQKVETFTSEDTSDFLKENCKNCCSPPSVSNEVNFDDNAESKSCIQGGICDQNHEIHTVDCVEEVPAKIYHSRAEVERVCGCDKGKSDKDCEDERRGEKATVEIAKKRIAPSTSTILLNLLEVQERQRARERETISQESRFQSRASNTMNRGPPGPPLRPPFPTNEARNNIIIQSGYNSTNNPTPISHNNSIINTHHTMSLQVATPSAPPPGAHTSMSHTAMVPQGQAGDNTTNTYEHMTQSSSGQQQHHQQQQQRQNKSVVPDLMEVYDAMTQSSTPQTISLQGVYYPNQKSNSGTTGTNVSIDAGETAAHDGTGKQTDVPSAASRRTSARRTQLTNYAEDDTSESGSSRTNKRKTISRSNSTTITAPSGASAAKTRRAKKAKSDTSNNASEDNDDNRKKGKVSSTDQRWSKRFTWPDELHRDFVSAIFDVGLKHSSPSAIMEHMRPNPDVTSERVKSHLQKYRLNRQKSRKEFMASYDSALAGFQKRQQQKEEEGGEDANVDLSIAESRGGLSCGEAAALCTHAMMNERAGIGDDSVAVPVESQEKESPQRHASVAARSSSSPENSGPDVCSTQSVEGLVTEAEGVPTLHLPLLTAEERDSPIGQSFGYLVGMFQTLSQQLELNRHLEAHNSTADDSPSGEVSPSAPAPSAVNDRNTSLPSNHLVDHHHQTNTSHIPGMQIPQHHQHQQPHHLHPQGETAQSNNFQQQLPPKRPHHSLQHQTVNYREALEEAAASAAHLHANDPSIFEVANSIPHALLMGPDQVANHTSHHHPGNSRQIQYVQQYQSANSTPSLSSSHAPRGPLQGPSQQQYVVYHQTPQPSFTHPQPATAVQNSNIKYIYSNNQGQNPQLHPPTQHPQQQQQLRQTYTADTAPAPPAPYNRFTQPPHPTQLKTLPPQQLLHHYIPTAGAPGSQPQAAPTQQHMATQPKTTQQQQYHHSQTSQSTSLVPCPLDSFISPSQSQQASSPETCSTTPKTENTSQSNPLNASPHLPGGGRTLQAQKESKLMKQEMRSQMAFQNKMRALKQIELSKYGANSPKSTEIEAVDDSATKTLDSCKETSSGNHLDQNHGQTFDENSHHNHPHEQDHQEAPAEHKENHGDNHHSPLRERSLSDNPEQEFWNAGDVDDQLFDFLMDEA
mmetsp:Transcript_3018/g.6439  ORF Transcript_3018/g.6439 Transcript_3018/m.6439 type:complete len:1543 (+) Transcript_3018:112-4740(+)